MSDDKSIQEKIAEAMPPVPEHRQGGDSTINMTHEEQRELTENIDAMVHGLLDKGYSPADLKVIFSGFDHRLNADRYDPHEYDRIALSLELRQTIQQWIDEQDSDVPHFVIAEALQDFAKVHREMGLREMYNDD